MTKKIRKLITIFILGIIFHSMKYNTIFAVENSTTNSAIAIESTGKVDKEAASGNIKGNIPNFMVPHSALHKKLYDYLMNEENRQSVMNRAVELHGGDLSNNCVYFASEGLRRAGLSSIPEYVCNTIQFTSQLKKMGWKTSTDFSKLRPGDICFTKSYGNGPTHTYVFMKWVDPSQYDYAYICDNQGDEYGGIYHKRNVSIATETKDPTVYFMYNPEIIFPNEKRFSGNDRYSTSINICKSNWDKSEYVVLVSGEDYPDALSAAPLAKKYNSPILLTNRQALKGDIKNQLMKLGVRHAFIVGGTGVISSNIENELSSMGIEFKRISGANRYETSLKVAENIGTDNGVVIASGQDFADALSIAPIAAVKQMPILLTEKNALPQSIIDYIKSNNVKKEYIVGGKSIISDNVFKNISNFKRLSGLDRYETNAAIINEFSQEVDFKSIYVATGNDFADALSGAAAAAKVKSPIVLTNGTKSLGQTALKDRIVSINQLNILGGESAVSKDAGKNLVNE